MDIKVKNLNLSVDVGGKAAINGFPFVEAQVSGENKDSHLGAKMICSSQGAKLRYVSHRFDGDKLVVTQRSDNLQAVTTFTFGAYDGYAVQTAYTNIGNETLTLEETSAFVLGVFAAVRNSEKTTLYTFNQSHHHECQPVANTLAALTRLYR